MMVLLLWLLTSSVVDLESALKRRSDLGADVNRLEAEIKEVAANASAAVVDHPST
jgi:hypothetical protein